MKTTGGVNMKRWQWLAAVVSLAATLAATPASAVHVYYSAEGGQNLTLSTITASAEGYSFLPMSDSTGGAAYFQGALFPYAATSTGGSVRIWYETTDTTNPAVCSWVVTVGAYNNGYSSTAAEAFATVTETVYSNTVAVTGTSQAHAADVRYLTPATSNFKVLNVGTGVLCAGSTCQGQPIGAKVALSTALTSATSCRLVAVDLDIQ